MSYADTIDVAAKAIMLFDMEGRPVSADAFWNALTEARREDFRRRARAALEES